MRGITPPDHTRQCTRTSAPRSASQVLHSLAYFSMQTHRFWSQLVPANLDRMTHPSPWTWCLWRLLPWQAHPELSTPFIGQKFPDFISFGHVSARVCSIWGLCRQLVHFGECYRLCIADNQSRLMWQWRLPCLQDLEKGTFAHSLHYTVWAWDPLHQHPLCIQGGVSETLEHSFHSTREYRS
jgi:hypothetical protein